MSTARPFPARAALLATATAAALAASALPAAAQAPAQVSLALSPATPSTGTTVKLSVAGGDGSELQGRQPTSFVLDAPGFAFDPKAVGVLCTAEQAGQEACPDASRIGTGSARLLVKNPFLPGGQETLTAALSVALGAPGTPGDLGTAQLSFSEPTSGMKGHAAGRILPAAGGLELRVEGIGGGDMLPPGTAVELQGLDLSVGAARVEKRVTTKRRRVKLKHPYRSRKTHRLVKTKVVTTKRTKRIPHALLTTPATCGGTFAATATVTFASGDPLVRMLTTPCTAGR